MTVYGLYFDKALYVSDYFNNRILKFPMNSTNSTFGIVVAGIGSQLNSPRGVIVDRNGIVYIADTSRK